jgi:HlyD family secretion protein
MDRPLDTAFLRSRARRRGVLIAALLSVTTAVFAWGPGLLRPTLRRSGLRIERVTSGPIEAVINASGVVLPEVEKVLSTPVEARVLRILRRPGTTVEPGDPIVELDLSAATLAVERLDQNLAIKRNQQMQTRLELEARLATLESQRRAKELSAKSLEAMRERRRELRAEGLVSAEDLQQAELTAAQAALELKQTQEDAAHAQLATKAKIEGLDLEIATLRKERTEAARLLSLGTMRADRSGVVTWTVTEEGAAVRSGEPVARVADLSSFRVEATVSDVHAKRLSAGLPATVKIGDDSLPGTVANVLPTIRDGVMTFNVSLQDRASDLLRSNLRVDVLVATGRREKALTLRRGPAIEGDGPRQLFVVRNGRAVKTPVRIGLLGFDTCEIVEGLSEGDEVVLSDMREYEHLSEVKVRP